MEHYFLIKHLHITAATLSILFFMLRAVWSVREAPVLQARWVRIAPHVIDTLLLTLGVVLMVMLSLWPHQHPWLAAKLIALRSEEHRRGGSPVVRGVAGVAAVLVCLYMLGAASRQSALSWLA